MKDFIGQELGPGDFIAYPGRGNAAAEYGLILMRILSIKGNQIKAERLKAEYPDFKHAKTSMIKVTLKSPTKIVRVEPGMLAHEVFINYVKHSKTVGDWLHGVSPINWELVK